LLPNGLAHIEWVFAALEELHLHTIVLTRSRTDPATRAYITRRLADGKTLRETKRCLSCTDEVSAPQGWTSGYRHGPD